MKFFKRWTKQRRRDEPQAENQRDSASQQTPSILKAELQQVQAGGVPAPKPPPPSVQRPSDIYFRHLSVKEFGYPLWIPEPNNRLPIQYQTNGVSIGDVGIITPSGSFDFLFNICSPADNLVNPRELPKRFAPIYPPLEPIDSRCYMEFKPNSYLASSSVERSRGEDAELSGLTFESSASEGAVLTMPHGAYAEELGNVARFRKYLAANAELWYQYVNGIRGREAQNGDIRLVIGCHKSNAWGIAAFSNLGERRDLRLKFQAIGEEGSAGLRMYEWEYSGMAEVRAGPSREEVEILRKAATQDSSIPASDDQAYQNQCLFMRTLNVTLRDDIWKRLSSELEVDPIDDHTYTSTDATSRSSASRSRESAPTSGSTSKLNNPSDYSTGSSLAPAVHIPDVPRSLTSHPSKAINEMLLRERPNAKLAITEDRDWISVLREDDAVLPDAEELCSRILAYHHIYEEDDCVFLDSGHDPMPPERGADTRSVATSEDTWLNAHSNFASHQSLLSGTTLDSAEERRLSQTDAQLVHSFTMPPFASLTEVLTELGKTKVRLAPSSQDVEPDGVSPALPSPPHDSSEGYSTMKPVQRVAEPSLVPKTLDDEAATNASAAISASDMPI